MDKIPMHAHVDAYIQSFPEPVCTKLEQLRRIIQKAAPVATETIKYNMPTFVYQGNLLSFGAWKNHIGVYPVPREDAAFRNMLTGYKGSKSTLQLPFTQPIPIELVKKIVAYNMNLNISRANAKRK